MCLFYPFVHIWEHLNDPSLKYYNMDDRKGHLLPFSSKCETLNC